MAGRLGWYNYMHGLPQLFKFIFLLRVSKYFLPMPSDTCNDQSNEVQNMCMYVEKILCYNVFPLSQLRKDHGHIYLAKLLQKRFVCFNKVFIMIWVFSTLEMPIFFPMFFLSGFVALTAHAAS